MVSLGIFSVVPPTEPCALRSTQPLKASTTDFSWGKGGRCVWLTTYHPCSAEISRKSGALIYPEPFGPPRPVAGHLYFTLLYCCTENMRFQCRITKTRIRTQTHNSQCFCFSTAKMVRRRRLFVTFIQGDSGGICSTLGDDTMCNSKQRSSYEHGSDFGRLRSYDRLKLRIQGNDY